MSETAALSPAAPASSFWDDAIEIFVHPAAVYRRRANASVWPPILFVALSVGVITFATFNVLTPIFEAEFARNTAKAIAQNPGAADAMNKMKDVSLTIARFTLPVILALTIVVVGLVSWLVSKMFGAVTTAQQAIAVAAWAYFPRVLGAIAGSTQALLMDPARLTSQLSISLSPARFMDVDTANPMVYQILGRFDLITIWVTVLLAIGIYVTGRISKGQAAGFGVAMWVIGSLPALRAAYMLM